MLWSFTHLISTNFHDLILARNNKNYILSMHKNTYSVSRYHRSIIKSNGTTLWKYSMATQCQHKTEYTPIECHEKHSYNWTNDEFPITKQSQDALLNFQNILDGQLQQNCLLYITFSRVIVLLSRQWRLGLCNFEHLKTGCGIALQSYNGMYPTVH